jgi:hypothetical protein
VLQYAYYQQTSGVIDYVIYETSVQASSWHIITLGVEVKADTLDFETPSDRERERLMEQRRRQQQEEIVRRFQPNSFSANRCPPGPKSRTVRAMNNRRAFPFSEAAPSCRARRIPSVRTMTTQHVATPQYFHPSPDDDG